MNIGQIKTFLLVTQKGSLSSAALDLGVNQTTLSRQIRELERQVGFSLLSRGYRGVVLTEQGKKFFDLCSKIISQLEYQTNCIKELGEEVQGPLTIIVGVGTFLQILPGIADFLKKYPKLNLNFQMNADLFNWQLNEYTGDTEALLLPFESVSHLNSIKHPVFEDHLRIYASKNYLEKYGHPQKLEDLKDHRLIIYKSLDDNPELKKINFHSSYLEEMNLFAPSHFEVNSGVALQGALHADLGIGVYWTEKLLGSEPLVDLFPDLPSVVVPYSFCYHPRLKESKKIKVFLEFLNDFFKN